MDQRLARKQREDLVGAREPELDAVLGRHADQFLPEQLDRARVGGEVAGHQVEESGLTGAVGADDQAPLAGHHRQRDVFGGRQAAEALVEAGNVERGRGHSAPSEAAPAAGAARARRRR
jgi:hypothetical protein